MFARPHTPEGGRTQEAGKKAPLWALPAGLKRGGWAQGGSGNGAGRNAPERDGFRAGLIVKDAAAKIVTVDELQRVAVKGHGRATQEGHGLQVAQLDPDVVIGRVQFKDEARLAADGPRHGGDATHRCHGQG